MTDQTLDTVAFPPETTANERDDMMAGSDIYRRIQAKPKKSAMGYIVPAVVVIALGAGALLYTMKPSTPSPDAASVARTAASQQQAVTSAQMAANAAAQADTAAKAATLASNDKAQSVSVSSNVAPRPAVTENQPSRERATTHRAEHSTIKTTPAPAANDAATSSDVNAYTPPAPPPVSVTPAPLTLPTAPTTMAPAAAQTAPSIIDVTPPAPQSAAPATPQPQTPAQPQP
jgi:hypothetical protein